MLGEFLHSNQVRLNTAAGGEGLPVLGQARPFKIYLEGVKQPLVIKPLVVKGLTNPMNLGMSLLQSHHCVLESLPTLTVLKFGRQLAHLVDSEDPIIPDHSKDARFSRDKTGYAQLGTLTLFKQDDWSRDPARKGRDHPHP